MQAASVHYAELRKKRPVMPWGISRSNTIANASMTISPITGPDANDTI